MEHDDHFNEETFGSATEDKNQLPNFFQTNATTVLDELEAMKLGGLESDDEGEVFPPAPLPSFFSTDTPPMEPIAATAPHGVPLPAGAKVVSEPEKRNAAQRDLRNQPPQGYFPMPPGMHPRMPPGMPYPPPWGGAPPGMYPIPPMPPHMHPQGHPHQYPQCPRGQPRGPLQQYPQGQPRGIQYPRPYPNAVPRPARPPQRLPVPPGSMMTQSDARYVVSRVLMTLEVKDPYADDFYYIQKTLKKATATATSAAKDIRVPLPSWSALAEAREAIFNDTKRAKDDRSRKWEEKEGVLGHIAKNEVSKPRNVVSLTPNSPTAAEVEPTDDSLTGNTPFSTVLWNMRQAVHRGFVALASVLELEMLLMTPSVASNPVAHAEIVYELGEAQRVLSRCVGVKVQSSESGESVMLEGGLVAALLQTVKGKKLLARAFPVLGLDQRWALLPAIIARMLHKNAAEQAPDDVAIEKTLLMRLTDFIATEYDLMMTSFRAEDAPPLQDACAHLLSLLRQCLKTVLVSQMEKAKLRASLIASRQRAEVMHVIVRTGDKLSSNMDEELLTDWMQLRDAFMQMLEE